MHAFVVVGESHESRSRTYISSCGYTQLSHYSGGAQNLITFLWGRRHGRVMSTGLKTSLSGYNKAYQLIISRFQVINISQKQISSPDTCRIIFKNTVYIRYLNIFCLTGSVIKNENCTQCNCINKSKGNGFAQMCCTGSMVQWLVINKQEGKGQVTGLGAVPGYHSVFLMKSFILENHSINHSWLCCNVSCAFV